MSAEERERAVVVGDELEDPAVLRDTLEDIRSKRVFVHLQQVGTIVLLLAAFFLGRTSLGWDSMEFHTLRLETKVEEAVEMAEAAGPSPAPAPAPAPEGSPQNAPDLQAAGPEAAKAEESGQGNTEAPTPSNLELVNGGEEGLGTTKEEEHAVADAVGAESEVLVAAAPEPSKQAELEGRLEEDGITLASGGAGEEAGRAGRESTAAERNVEEAAVVSAAVSAAVTAALQQRRYVATPTSSSPSGHDGASPPTSSSEAEDASAGTQVAGAEPTTEETSGPPAQVLAGEAARVGEASESNKGVDSRGGEWPSQPVQVWSDKWAAVPDTYGPEVGCAPGCEKWGTCNEELGRCDCPVDRTGANCTIPTMPSCELVPGYFQRCASITEHIPTCECAMECDQAGWALKTKACLRRMDELTTKPGPEITHITADGKLRVEVVYSSVHSGVELFSDHAHRHASDSPEYDVPHDEFLKDRQYKPLTMCPNECTKRGVCVQMRGTPNAPPSCHCYDEYAGTSCEIELGMFCINECSGNGKCHLGFCKCNQGFWGVDCSESKPADDKASDLRPLIYVYDVPRAMTTGQFGLQPVLMTNPGCLHREYSRDTGQLTGEVNAYMAQSYLHERILNSPFHTRDASKADYFLIPLYEQCLTGSGAHIVPWADWILQYVKQTWPYWNATGGVNHMLILPDDQGGCDLKKSMPAWQNVTFLHHFGYNETREMVDHSHTPLPCHTPGKDIVMPPALGSRLGKDWDAIDINTGKRKYGKCPRKKFFFFAGAAAIPGYPTYSGGVRERVYELFKDTPGYRLVDIKKTGNLGHEAYAEAYQSAVFCLAPSGLGWGIRTVIAIFYGCIPVIIQDNISMPFEEYLPWDDFSVRLPNSRIEYMDDELRALPDAAILLMQKNLACVWPKLFWSSIHGRLRDEKPEEEDAFDVLMKVMRSRLAGGNTPPLSAEDMCTRPPVPLAEKPPLCKFPCAPGLTRGFKAPGQTYRQTPDPPRRPWHDPNYQCPPEHT